MKKLIALLLAILLVLTMTGCGTNDDVIPPDNKYVAMAKEHGYWHGMGGVSWGMSIDETLEVLNLTKEDVEIGEDDSSNSVVLIKGIAVEKIVYGFPARIQFEYKKAIEPNTSILAEKEWLTSINIIFEEVHNYETIIPFIQADVKDLNAEYDEKTLKWSGVYTWKNKKSLNSITDKELTQKVTSLYKTLVLEQDKTDEELSHKFDDSLDGISLVRSDDDFNVRIIMLTGFTAAILANTY